MFSIQVYGGHSFIEKYEVMFHKFNAHCILLDSISLKIVEVLSLTGSCGLLFGVP